MAVQEGRKTIDSITKISIFAVSAVALFQNLFGRALWQRETYREDFEHYMIELDENSQNYPSMKVRVKWSLGQFERFIARNTVLCLHLTS